MQTRFYCIKYIFILKDFTWIAQNVPNNLNMHRKTHSYNGFMRWILCFVWFHIRIFAVMCSFVRSCIVWVASWSCTPYRTASSADFSVGISNQKAKTTSFHCCFHLTFQLWKKVFFGRWTHLGVLIQCQVWMAIFNRKMKFN